MTMKRPANVLNLTERQIFENWVSLRLRFQIINKQQQQQQQQQWKGAFVDALGLPAI